MFISDYQLCGNCLCIGTATRLCSCGVNRGLKGAGRWGLAAGRMSHLHTQLHRFALLPSQSHSAHRGLQLAQRDARLIHVAEVLRLHANRKSGHRVKHLLKPLNSTWMFNSQFHLCYLLFGDVELTPNDLCHSQATFRPRQHGCETVEGLIEGKKNKTKHKNNPFIKKKTTNT